MASAIAASDAWSSGNLADTLLALGGTADDGVKDDLKGGKGDDHLIAGFRDKAKQ